MKTTEIKFRDGSKRVFERINKGGKVWLKPQKGTVSATYKVYNVVPSDGLVAFISVPEEKSGLKELHERLC